ncbi:MAG: hypothetical protein A4E60_00585 [Syntrophorhabdus sp. PtaB.Bin047]|nr:MAG: hypothetical protein A4E60_00585 [Syntrophorhabdus sp. PtaB.Bin047]
MKSSRFVRIVLVALFLSLPGIVSNVAAQKSDSFVFVGNQGNFSVEVPKEFKDFKYSSEPLDTKAGKREIHVYKSLTKTMGFTVMIIDHGKQQVTDQQAIELSEMARAKLSQRGKVLSKSKGKLAGKPALVLFDSMDAGGEKVYSETWFAFIDGKQFQLSYLTTNTKQITNPAAARFFTSFKYPVK